LKNINVLNIKFEGASFLYVDGIAESGNVVVEGCTFKDMDGEDGTGIRGIITGGFLEIKKTLFSNINGRAIYLTEGSLGEIYINETTFENCECDNDDNKNEGCGIYLFINDDCIEDYKFHRLIFSYSPQFTGSVIYIDYPSLFESASSDDYEPKFEGWNSNNYLLNITNGIGYNRKVDVLRSYPIIFFFSAYSASTIYITQTSIPLPSFDGRWCGRDVFPCASISYGKTRLSNPPSVGSVSNSLKIIGNIEFSFTGESILLQDVTLTSSNSVVAIITIISSTSSPSVPVISYKSALNIENIEFKLGVNDNNNIFNSLIGDNNKQIFY
jgi:hypothetical protein